MEQNEYKMSWSSLEGGGNATGVRGVSSSLVAPPVLLLVDDDCCWAAAAPALTET